MTNGQSPRDQGDLAALARFESIPKVCRLACKEIQPPTVFLAGSRSTVVVTVDPLEPSHDEHGSRAFLDVGRTVPCLVKQNACFTRG